MEQDVHAPGHRRARRRVPGHQPLRPDRPRARLRVERDDLGPGHRRHVRRRPLRAGRARADDTLDALPLRRAVPADRGPRAAQRVAADRGRRDAGGQRDARGRAHRAGARARPRARSAAGRSPSRAKRSTYGHETDSGLAFRHFNDPDRIRGAAGLPARGRARHRHVQLVVRRQPLDRLPERRREPAARAADRPEPADRRPPALRVAGRALARASARPRARPHPNALDQAYFADWNGKQGRGYGAADGNWGYGPVYRSQLLENRVRRLVRGPRRTTLPALAEAMADAATVDLRGNAVLPLRAARARQAARPRAARRGRQARRVAARPARTGSTATATARYEHAEAIADHGRVVAALGARAVRARRWARRCSSASRTSSSSTTTRTTTATTSARRGRTAGTRSRRRTCAACSAAACAPGRARFCGRRPAAPLPGRARPRRCARRSAVPAAELYRDDVCAGAGRDGDQTCFDAIWHRPLGGLTQPLIPWQNRPTFQQVVEIPAAAAALSQAPGDAAG